MRIYQAAVVITGLLCVMMAGAARAVSSICLLELPELFAQEFKIPVGCELVDCCPGCPLDPPLDWQVTVDGDAVAAAYLSLESRDRIRLPRGTTRIEAVAPSGRSEDPAPIASLGLELDGPVLRRWRSEAGPSDSPKRVGLIDVHVEQMLGKLVVSDFRMKWNVFNCFKPEPCDQIVQTNNLDGDDSVILLDSRRRAASDGCENDQIARSANSKSYSNILKTDGCASDIAVFSAQNAVAFLKDATAWTNECGDIAPVPLAPLVTAPVNFWIALNDNASGDWFDMIPAEWWGQTGTMLAVEEDLNLAAQLFDENKTGIGFAPLYTQLSKQDWKTLREEVFTLPFLLKLLAGSGLPSIHCAIPGELETLGFYKKDELNVYYLPIPFTGMNCSDDPNVVFVGLVKKDATLAHEFGHAFSMLPPFAHSNNAGGFDKTNIMWVKETAPRTHFSLGQAFRMSIDENSVLNTNNVRLGDTRPCPTDADSADCPRLGLDWMRP